MDKRRRSDGDDEIRGISEKHENEIVTVAIELFGWISGRGIEQTAPLSRREGRVT
jgi:hypothetical protein